MAIVEGRHIVSITAEGEDYRVMVDGRNVGEYLTGFTVYGRRGQVPSLELEVEIAPGVVRVEGEALVLRWGGEAEGGS